MEPDWGAYARRALAEDHAACDVTTQLLGKAAERPAEGVLVAQEACVVAGLPLAAAAFSELDPAVEVIMEVSDGQRVQAATTLATVRGPARALVGAERVALNYLQHLSGVATITGRVVDLLQGTGAVVTDTRKTTPGLRTLEKYAVRVAGGTNHRAHLEDAVLWKDNHWRLLEMAGESLDEALRRVPPGVPVQVEAETEDQFEIALRAGVTNVLVDNQTPETVARWVERAGPAVVIEASGGISPDGAVAYARAGARRISMGALTHSPAAAVVHFEIVVT